MGKNFKTLQSQLSKVEDYERRSVAAQQAVNDEVAMTGSDRMGKPYKIIEKRLYTGTIIYDAEGNEVDWFHNNDDYSYDESDPIPLTDEEIEDHDLAGWLPVR